MTTRRALITGINGQDGSFLAELLLREGYEVAGLVRPPTARDLPNLRTIRDDVQLLAGDLLDPESLRSALSTARPDEIYHLAAPTFVPDSWRDPTRTVEAIVGGTAALLAGVLALGTGPRTVVMTSSEVFGDARESPQHEDTPMRPASPYGVAKLAAHGLVGTMRAHHGLHLSSAITYNHESVRRPERFLPRKVTRGAAAIALGRQDELVLGDLRAVRDWSDARDVVRGVHLMARADEPGDYVLASGQPRMVGELVDAAFARAGVPTEGRIRVDPAFVRPPESTPPVGDPSRAHEHLGWRAEIPFEQTIGEMVDADLAALGRAAA
ncbi:MAG: GDPmannose 4,6-dehydratase [Solirubrobacteraceae bacterium]|nr:GDPmannose 4,6-dehydratase [Solirubrobacteraceae bacterium]